MVAKARAGRLLRADGAPRLALGRAVGLALLVIVLAFAVAVGSAGSPLHIGGPSPVLQSRLYFGDLIAILLLLLAGFWAVLLYLTWVGARGLRPGRDVGALRRRPGALFRALTIVSATLLAFALLARNGSFDRLLSPGETPLGRSRGRDQNQAVDQAPATPVHWWIVAGFVTLAAAAVVILLLRRNSAKSGDKDETQPEADALVEALDLSLDDLEGERDPRRAVIRAYARMERALALHGLPRRPHETSLEYLARLLTSLRVSRPSVKRLTSLFERAKFSHHAVDSAMKAEALEALSTVRAELEP
jgi:Domain of unknown function (DUF4129)